MENAAINLSDIQIIPIKPRDGLLAFVSFLLNSQFFCGNIAIHSRPDGNLRLVYPQKLLPNGKTINCFHPVDQQVANTVLEQVSDAYLHLISKCGQNATICEDRDETLRK